MTLLAVALLPSLFCDSDREDTMRKLVFVLGLVVLANCFYGCGGPGAGPASSPSPAAKSEAWTRPPEFAPTASLPAAATDPAADRASPGMKSMSAPDAGYSEPRVDSTPIDRPPTVPPAESRRAERDRVARAARNVRSGTLTAGSFDDNERFDEFRRFLALAMQQDSHETLPRLAVGDRVIIVVRNDEGEPIGHARVTVLAVDPQQRRERDELFQDSAVFEASTGSDGRTMFLPAAVDAGAKEFLVSVSSPHGGRPVSEVFRIDQQSWQVTLHQAAAKLPQRLDLALVIDTTGSMGDELEYLKVEIDSIAAEVHRMFPNVDQRYALIVYRDQGDQYVTRTFDFTGSLDDFRSTLSEQFASGGGDYPEAVHLALEQAGRLSWRDRDTARVMFLVGDAPPHDEHLRQTLNGVLALKAKGVRVFPVAASGVDLKAEFVMRATAFLTLGQYLFLTDHSGVGNPHAKPHVPEYTVEHLNRLMIRMIAGELAGKRLTARDIGAYSGQQSSQSHKPEVGTTLGYVRPRPNYGKSLADLCPPRWVILAVTIIFWFIIEAAIERHRRARHPVQWQTRMEI